MKHSLKCRNCGSHFDSSYPHKAFCELNCQKKWHKRAQDYKHYKRPMATATVGAIGELRVATDLLIKGYEVFRAISAACSCDLAVVKNRKLYRIEVRTCYKNSVTGQKIRAKTCDLKSENYDIYAAVYKDEIEYVPELP